MNQPPRIVVENFVVDVEEGHGHGLLLEAGAFPQNCRERVQVPDREIAVLSSECSDEASQMRYRNAEDGNRRTEVRLRLRIRAGRGLEPGDKRFPMRVDVQ